MKLLKKLLFVSAITILGATACVKGCGRVNTLENQEQTSIALKSGKNRVRRSIEFDSNSLTSIVDDFNDGVYSSILVFNISYRVSLGTGFVFTIYDNTNNQYIDDYDYTSSFNNNNLTAYLYCDYGGRTWFAVGEWNNDGTTQTMTFNNYDAGVSNTNQIRIEIESSTLVDQFSYYAISFDSLKTKQELDNYISAMTYEIRDTIALHKMYELRDTIDQLRYDLRVMTEDRDYYKTNYESVSQIYLNLVSDYNRLNANYIQLQEEYQALQESYQALEREYQEYQAAYEVPDNLLKWCKLIIKCIADLLNIEILPYIKLGYLFVLPILFGLVSLFLKLVRGA